MERGASTPQRHAIKQSLKAYKAQNTFQPTPPTTPASPWQVVAEMRSGHLSESNWKYLHGQPVEGCTLSAAERKSRKRVIDSPQDPRLSEDRFLKGTVIVANNDAKCQINKDRATSFAQAANVPIRWSVARDKAGTEVLQTQACDKSAKIRWLRYHDMDTEGLLGMLPLAVGLPVHLTQHVDRSDKCLLKGRLGYVHSWEWLENEQQPRVVSPSRKEEYRNEAKH